MDRMRVERLLDGSVFRLEATVLTIRRATAADRRVVLAMQRRCSAASLRRRYLGAVAGRLDRLVDQLVPPARGVSIGAFNPSGDCVGLANMVPLADRDAVELAVLVQDGWQRYGVGLRLSQVALAMPERAGRSVWLLSQADNVPSIALARRLGHRGAPPRVDAAFVELEIEDASLLVRTA
jgi:acetyltransferase (GNAT) family protein